MYWLHSLLKGIIICVLTFLRELWHNSFNMLCRQWIFSGCFEKCNHFSPYFWLIIVNDISCIQVRCSQQFLLLESMLDKRITSWIYCSYRVSWSSFYLLNGYKVKGKKCLKKKKRNACKMCDINMLFRKQDYSHHNTHIIDSWATILITNPLQSSQSIVMFEVVYFK